MSWLQSDKNIFSNPKALIYLSLYISSLDTGALFNHAQRGQFNRIYYCKGLCYESFDLHAKIILHFKVNHLKLKSLQIKIKYEVRYIRTINLITWNIIEFDHSEFYAFLDMKSAKILGSRKA